MITPFRIFVLALIVGVGSAALIAWQTPNPPPEVGYTEAVAPPILPQGPSAPTSRPAVALASGTRTVTPSGLTIVEVKEGSGVAAKVNDYVTVHYIGRLFYGGDQFDSSYDRGQPLPFTIGAGQLIKGFDEGVIGMKVGGKRQLVIPPELGYGDQTTPGNKIPPNSTLLFEVEMMSNGGKH